jgi:hypothetical protein
LTGIALVQQIGHVVEVSDAQGCLAIAYAEVYLVSGWCKKSDNAKATVKIGFTPRLMLKPLIR